MELLFCYCCRVHHPKDQMRLYPTSRGLRWRCQRSITAARLSRSERDAFGQQQTSLNQNAARLSAEYGHQLRRLRTVAA